MRDERREEIFKRKRSNICRMVQIMQRNVVTPNKSLSVRMKFNVTFTHIGQDHRQALI